MVKIVNNFLFAYLRQDKNFSFTKVIPYKSMTLTNNVM